MGKKGKKTGTDLGEVGRDALEAVGETLRTGEDISVNAEELSEYLINRRGSISEAVAYVKKKLTEAFNSKRADGVTDENDVIGQMAEILVKRTEAVRKALADTEVAGKVGEAIRQATAITTDALDEAAGATAGVVHGATRAAVNAAGATPGGMPDIKDGEEHLSDALEAMDDAVPQALEEAARSVTEAVVEGIGEEIVEAAFEAAPVVGSVVPAYNLILGGGTVVAGMGGLLYAGVEVVLGDNGKATSAAIWSGSMSAEGTIRMAKGFVGLLSQVPGMQLVTTPSSVCLGVAAKSVREQREDGERKRQKREESASNAVGDVDGAITKDSFQVDKTYHLISADGKRILQANDAKSTRGWQWLQKLVHSDKLHFAGFSLSFAEDLQAPGTLFSFSVRRTADTYIVHSAARDDHSLFFLGSTCPREWVVWDVPNMKGDWEELQLKWASSEKTFKIKGHDNQYVRWEKSGGGDGSGVFKATSSPSKATDFVLREAGG